ncbi:MAG: zinc ribbon domain-containing protein [Microthrixaceae bacterium]
MRHCPACGGPLTGNERFCPACGTEIGLVTLDPLGTRTPTSDSALVASPPRRGLRQGLILAGVALAGIIGWQLTQRDPGSDTSAPTSTVTRPTTTTTTSARADATTTPPTQPTPPARVELPAGLTGHLIAATRDELIDINLATGNVATTPLQDRLSIDRVVALDNTIIGLGSDGAFAISPDDGSTRAIIDGAYVSYLGDDGNTLLVATDAPDRQQALRLIRDDGRLIDVHPDAVDRMLGGPSPIHDGQVVITAGQGVGLMDPTTGTGRLIGEGALIAANRDVLIRVVCQPDLHCNWIIGDYDGNQHHTIDAPTDIVTGFGLASISTDGTALVGLAFGPGQPVLHAMDLATGAIRPVDNPPHINAIFERQFAITHDGHWLIIRNAGGDIELLSLTDPTSHTLDLNLPGSIQALTVTG